MSPYVKRKEGITKKSTNINKKLFTEKPEDKPNRENMMRMSSLMSKNNEGNPPTLIVPDNKSDLFDEEEDISTFASS